MAKRRFQLPGIQDLSKEQEKVRALPLDGQHLIIGGPGTGKSVMALLRARVLREEKRDYLFLVFNHLLDQASQTLFEGQLTSRQWQSWFMSLFKRLFKAELPRLPGEKSKSFKEFDWDSIKRQSENFEGIDTDHSDKFLIIDEGQDMPPEFYESLVSLEFENFFIVADQNQKIVDGKNSSRNDLQAALGLEASAVFELTENYRNQYAIARLARSFYVHDPASPPTALPDPPAFEVKKPMLFRYTPNQFRPIIHRILKMSDNNPRKLIGILCPGNEVRERYYNALLTEAPRLDNGRPNITTFKSGDKHRMPFDEGGVMVINAQACKGLEFDIVFIADVDEYKFLHQDKDRTRRLFYVMVARAIENVIMLRKAGGAKPIDEIIPQDNTSILEIK
jgi:DNA helicase-2/ATP-dependent DNA helicase PcrA